MFVFEYACVLIRPQACRDMGDLTMKKWYVKYDKRSREIYGAPLQEVLERQFADTHTLVEGTYFNA